MNFCYKKTLNRSVKTLKYWTVSSLLLCAGETFSQTQQIKLPQHQLTIQEIFNYIEKQTQFSVGYNHSKVSETISKKVSVNSGSVQSVLDKALQGTGLTFKYSGNHIVIIPKNNKKISAKGDERQIKGKVIDSQGMPVIGATVMEKGTTNGTVTDLDGNFILNAEEGVTVEISYIGYQTQNIIATGGKILSITMKEDAELLDEVVVVGYGTQKKVNLTGSVAVVEKEILESRPVSNIATALQGTVPGLTIGATGAPGSTASIRLRGQGSLSNDGNTPPYILIDGVPSDEESMLNLNPDDVENISVLKDAAASAIYGARAAFGVILITTKSGSGKKDKLEVNYSNNLDFAAFTVIPEMTNSVQFAKAYNEAYANAGKVGMFTDEWFVKAQQKIDDPTAPGTEPYSDKPNMWKRNFDSFDNVDWYDVYFKPGFSAFQQKHTLSLSGTTEKINYYVSAGFRDNVSNMRFGDWKNTQYSALARLNAKVTKWLDMGLNVRYSNGLTTEPTGNNDGDGSYMIFHNIWRSWPMTFLMDPNGNYNFQTTVPWLINGGRTSKTKEQLVLTPTFRINPLEGWTINFDFTAKMDFNTTKSDKQNIPEMQVDGTPNQATWDARQKNTYAYKSFSRSSYYTFNLYSSYDKKIGNHSFTVMLGMQYEKSNYMSGSARRYDILFPSIPTLGLSGGDRSVGDSESEWATFGSFARLNYNYKNRYLVEFNGRYDGSAKFKSGRRWGFFPSFSLGYNISNEEYWESLLDKVNLLKLRLSFGKLGNQNVSSFTYLPTMSHDTTDFIMNGMRPLYVQAPGLISNSLTWEKSQTFNVGLDAGLLNNRLTFSLDVYNRKTYDMFGPSQKLPAVIGTGLPSLNNASLSTKGFEITLGWRDNIGDFSYDIMGTLSDHTTEITEYYNPTGIMSSWSVGRKLGEIWGYETDRYFTEDDFIKDVNGNYKLKDGIPSQDYFYSKWSPGDIKYVDQNGDGKVDQGKNTMDDHGDKVLLGNSTPRFEYGINLGAQYKGFDLRLFFQGVGKRDIFTGDVTFWGFESRSQSNLTIQHLDFWTPENTDAYYPKPYLEGDNIGKNHQTQSKYLLNGAYCRLKNIQFGYTFPTTLIQLIGLTKVRVYISGENLLTWSKFPEFYDPEVYGKTHPIQKHISFGINVGF